MAWLDRWRNYVSKAQSRQSASALPGNLKRLMAERGVTTTTLAAKAHVSSSTIRALLTENNYDVPEADRRHKGPTHDPNPTLTTLLAVSCALEVGIEALVEDREQ